MKMTLGISNGKLWSIVLLLAVIFISLILSHMPFLVNNHYAYEGMTDASGGKSDVGVAGAGAGAGTSAGTSAGAAKEPSIMDKIKSFFGLDASANIDSTVGTNNGANGMGASAKIGPLSGPTGGSLKSGVAMDSVMPATPALLKGKQENFEALKEGAHKKVSDTNEEPATHNIA